MGASGPPPRSTVTAPTKPRSTMRPAASNETSRSGTGSEAASTQAPAGSSLVRNVLPCGAAGADPQPRSTGELDVFTSPRLPSTFEIGEAVSGRTSLDRQPHDASRCTRYPLVGETGEIWPQPK